MFTKIPMNHKNNTSSPQNLNGYRKNVYLGDVIRVTRHLKIWKHRISRESSWTIRKNRGALKYLKNSKWDAYSNPNEPRKQQIFLPKLE
jgi:hypothetical protein